MSAGQLRDYVRIITKRTADDSAGGQTPLTPDVVSTFAAIRPLSSRELASAGGVQSVGTHIVTIPYRSGVDTTQLIEVVPDGVTFEIVGVIDPDRRQRILELTCVEAK